MKKDLFRKFDLFEGLSEAELEKVAALAKPRKYQRDEVIFHADERGDVFCLIVTGRVKVTMISPEGKEIILSMLGPGDFFGEMALLDDEPRSATVMAVEPLEVLTVYRDELLQIMRDDFTITRNIIAELSKRLRRASRRIESLVTMDVYGRLARFLLELARDQGREVDNGYVAFRRPTHQAIANTIGTSRETVSRLLHDLMEQKLLLCEGKTIYLRKGTIDQFKERSDGRVE